MNIALLGEQISKYRKERGMTQEELGRAVGVSTQAVSRWENGGAPDVALLPAIADTLGVAVDALFGREGGEVRDIKELVTRYTGARPSVDFPVDMNGLVWRGVMGLLGQAYGPMDIPPMEHGQMEKDGHRVLSLSMITTDKGLLMGSYARDMSFVSIYPEPEAGYAAYYAQNEEYRRFFAALAMPYSLEVLLLLDSEARHSITAPAVCRRLGAEGEEAERVAAALAALAEVNALDTSELETENGIIPTYYMCKTALLTPLLYPARYMLQSDNLCNIGADMRSKPWLRGER